MDRDPVVAPMPYRRARDRRPADLRPRPARRALRRQRRRQEHAARHDHARHGRRRHRASRSSASAAAKCASFIEHDLGPEGLERVRRRGLDLRQPAAAPAARRLRAPPSIAEYFRDQGLNVLLLMDSVTRFAMAQREVGLAAGEPPTTKGYPPSVFALLPALLERAGAVRGRGSITAMYTVLVDGDDHNEPIADAVRVDPRRPHRALARSGVAASLSADRRAAERQPDDAGRDRRRRIASSAAQVREWMAAIRDSEDLVSVGAYVPGSNPRIDEARAKADASRSSFVRTPTRCAGSPTLWPRWRRSSACSRSASARSRRSTCGAANTTRHSACLRAPTLNGSARETVVDATQHARSRRRGTRRDEALGPTARASSSGIGFGLCD